MSLTDTPNLEEAQLTSDADVVVPISFPSFMDETCTGVPSGDENAVEILHVLGTGDDAENDLVQRKASLLRHIMTDDECAAFIEWGETQGFRDLVGYKAEYRSNTRIAFHAPKLAELMFERLRPHLPTSLVIPGADSDLPHDPSLGRGHKIGQDGVWRPLKLNTLFRLCRYHPGNAFAPHYDGQFVESEECVSFQTFMIYLNGGLVDEGGPMALEGACTNFVRDDQPLYTDPDTGRYCAPPDSVYLQVPPERGMAILFNAKILHEGDVLESGVKYILRTDVMYARDEGSRVPGDPTKEEALRVFQEASRAEDSGDMETAMKLYRKAFKLDPELGFA